ncbi:SLBB domain-containing protein [Nitrospirillum pindoramense]|nr:SLBB domain-containing protein [Nitrospirillum amazonense]
MRSGRTWAHRALLLAALASGVTPGLAQAQGLAQLLGGGNGNDLTGDLLRTVQQRLTGQSTVPSLQPDVQMQNPPGYGPQGPGAQIYGPPSAIERLMSARAGQPIRQYGYEVFGRGGPVVVRQSGALQDSYVLGEGDEIVLTLRGQQNASYRTRVDRDGRVVFPGLPPIAGAGRPFGAFREDLEDAASRALTGTEVLVSVGAVRQIAVRVAGEVNAPGLFTLSGLATAMDALSLAGGVKNTGSLRDVQVVRGGRSFRLDLYTLLMGDASGHDIPLAEGDRIVVPLQTSAVAIVGQVKRPAIYELPAGQQATPLTTLMAMAGGTEVRGSYRYSILRTREDGKREMVQVGAGGTATVRDGDVVFVAPTADVSLAKVELRGATTLNGSYPLETVRSLRGLLGSSDMFTPTVGRPLPYLLADAVIRLDPATLQRTVIPFAVSDVLEGKADVALQSNDVVYITNVAEMRYIARKAGEQQRNPTRKVNDHPDPVAPPPAPDATAMALQAQMAALPPGAAADPRLAQLAALQGMQLPAGQGMPSGGVLGQGAPALAGTNPAYAAFAAAQMGQQAQSAQDQGPPRPEEERLNPGIVAPPEVITSQDGTTTRADDDEEQSGALPVTGTGALSPSQLGAAQALAQRPKRPPLRLFVGLDDDARRLLVGTLANYHVTVVGEVNSPGDFLVMPGATLDKLVQASGGLTPKVDLHAFEVTSAEIDNASGLSRTVRHTYGLPVAQFAQVALKPFDRVRFNPVFSDRDTGDVTLAGEVKFPGGYEILRGEHLSSVLARAGGFTDAAYPAGVVFLRQSVAESQRDTLQKEADALERQIVSIVGNTSSKVQVTDGEIAYVTQMINRLRQGTGPASGRVSVHVDPREIAAHPELDIVMEPGDQLVVPRQPSAVVVSGEVMAPGGIQFRTDRSVDDYIAMAGGMTEIADDDHVFVVQPDGSAVQVNGGGWLSAAPKLAPGSVIVVPRKLRHFTWDSILMDIVQVTSQLAITGASLAVISR